MEAPTVKKILKQVPPGKIVAKLIKRSSFLRDYVRDILGYLERREFKVCINLIKELDRNALNEILRAVSEPELTEKEFIEFRGYLYTLWREVYSEYERFLDLVKALKTNSIARLPEKKLKDPAVILNKLKRGEPITFKGYKDLTYRVALFLNKDFKVIDARIFATKDTHLKFVKRAKERNLYILITPNPVKIPKEFWLEYRRAKGPAERVSLIKKYGLLKDEQAIYLELIVDIDSPYEEVEKVVKEFLKELEVEKEPFQVKLMKTGSGNARLIIPLKLVIWKTTEKGRNGHTHLENLREAVAIIGAYFQRKGLNVDTTSIDRLNHQIWCYSAHPKPDKYEIKRVVPTLQKITPYELYRRVKKLQKEQQLYILKKGNKEINLTTYFGWRPEFKKNSKRAKVIRVPKFIAKLVKQKVMGALDEEIKLYYWKKGVKSLADRHSHYRFTYVILPAVGWAKYLGLDRYEVERYLQEVLSDRDWRKTEKDINTAFRVANPLEFDLPKKARFLNFETLLREVLKYLLRNEQVARQELLKEIFGNQKWLTDLVMNALEKIGLVEVEFVKAGKGRPRKVFRLTEKGRQVADHLSEEIIQEVWKVAVGQDFSSRDFSHADNSPSGSRKEVDGKGVAGENKEDLINLTKKGKESALAARERAQEGFAKEKKTEGEREKGKERKREKDRKREGPEKGKRKGKGPEKGKGKGKGPEKGMCKKKDPKRGEKNGDRYLEKEKRKEKFRKEEERKEEFLGKEKRADRYQKEEKGKENRTKKGKIISRKQAEEILNRLRKGKPKRGGVSSIGEVIKGKKSASSYFPPEGGPLPEGGPPPEGG